jgi:hypothetical protein
VTFDYKDYQVAGALQMTLTPKSLSEGFPAYITQTLCKIRHYGF